MVFSTARLYRVYWTLAEGWAINCLIYQLYSSTEKLEYSDRAQDTVGVYKPRGKQIYRYDVNSPSNYKDMPGVNPILVVLK
jgi:hypothetical protein